jgi:taurine dioxygenase
VFEPIRPSREFRTIDVLPMTGALGAEVRGVDLAKPFDNETWDEILGAFTDYLVLVLPEQDITHEQHLAFARRFGKIIQVPQLFSVPEAPELQQIRREADARGRVVGEGWHSDSTFLEKPPGAAILHAIDVPPFGGDTAFTSLTLAYETLSDAMKQLIDGLNAVHSAAKVYGSKRLAEKQRSFAIPDNEEEGNREVVHPVVCTHPLSGRKTLYVNSVYTQRFEGMTEEESAPLLGFLIQHCSKLDFTCRIRWRDRQVLVWDNRATYHKALADYDGFFRYLVRATAEGPRPVH